MRLRVYIDCLKIYIRAFRARCCLEQSVLVCPVYHVIAPVFWFCSRLVANQEIGTFQQLSLPSKLVVSSRSLLTSRLRKARPPTSSSCSIQFLKLMQSRQKARFWATRQSEVISSSRTFISVTRQDRGSVYCMILLWKLSLGLTLYWLVLVDAGRALCESYRWWSFIALNIDRIQLIERFYDPLAGNVFVRHCFLSIRYQLKTSQSWTSNPIASRLPWCLKNPPFMLEQSGLVSYWALLKPMEEVTQEGIENACRDANILEFIKSLPEWVCGMLLDLMIPLTAPSQWVWDWSGWERVSVVRWSKT